MTSPASPAATAPLARWRGLALVAALTLAAYLGAPLAGGLLSPLVLALLLGMAWRGLALRERGLAGYVPGVTLAAGPLLKAGIVALGARLDARLLLELGPAILFGSVVGALTAWLAIEVVGRAWRVGPELRTLLGIGTAICGASAIVAAGPLCRARAEHVAVAIATISLVGTAGVLGFAAWDALAVVPTAAFAALAGATLQEVGQVLAAGSVQGQASADLALLVKLSRVVLLAPALVLTSALAARRGADDSPLAPAVDRGAGALTPTPRRRPLVPPFVIGFLALGGGVSAGLVPAPVVDALALVGLVLTAAAMAAIGLGVDLRAVRRAGVTALALGAAGMIALMGAMLLYYTWVLT
jgi:uncharacterized integral membrane protein (TIGR00698 family)